MRLYIAEKPSMGREIAKCLEGPYHKGNGFIKTKDGIVTWLFGHILELAKPEEYDIKYRRWNMEDLPIVPQKWQLGVTESCAQQFQIVKELISKASEIIHAGDPDREGQLLVDELLDFLGSNKPVKRILLNALDEKSIRDANNNLRDNADFANLKNSALARSRADWLIGMNLSRAFTLAARRCGNPNLILPVGRVKTPTLALVVRREREIKNFKPVDYYGIKADFQHKNGTFSANWQPKEDMSGLDAEGRLIDKKIAETMLQRFTAEPHFGQLTNYSKTKKQEPQRLPFSLSTLQVTAGKRFGYAPQLVLDTAQSLYEKKLTTYPRSDCEFLPTNQYGDRMNILTHLKQINNAQLTDWATRADISIKSRAWNNNKISAHHAIIPTRIPANSQNLTEAERNIYFLIAQAYIAQFYPLHTYNQTKVEITYKDELFTASGRVILEMGWKEIYSSQQNKNKEYEQENEKTDDEAAPLPLMAKKDTLQYLKGDLITKTTKPPVRFNPSTLLAAMKDIHKYVKDPEAKKKLKDVYGIGTEATRATIIEDLIKRKFLTATGKKQILTPNDSAYLLIDAMPDELAYPDYTAIWEDNLQSMSTGKYKLETFLQEQIKFTKTLCDKAKNITLLTTAGPDGKSKTLEEAAKEKGQTICPRCKQGILTQKHGKNGTFWGCSNYPQCRMTCNDKDNKPDLEAAQRNNIRRQTSGIPAATSYYNTNYSTNYTNTADEDYSILNNYDPYACITTYQKTTTNHQSAMPMEKLARKENAAPAKNNTSSSPAMPKGKPAPKGNTAHPNTSTSNNKHLCPRCKKGYLRSITGKNGTFWGCKNYPRCTATYDDKNNTPCIPLTPQPQT